jgi:hypothetical protein
MHQTQPGQSTRHPGNSIPALADALELLAPEPLAAIFRHQELSLGAKALATYMVCQPRGRLFTRAEFERLSFDTAHLQDVLHEATRVGLIAPFPTGERPCCAVTFRFLLEDS